MKFSFVLSILLLTLITVNIFGQATIDLKKPKHIRVGEAYSYIFAQDFSLDRIKNQFPQFAIDILKAKNAFNLTFGRSSAGMKKYLTEYLGQNEFSNYEVRLNSELKKMFGSQMFTKEIATNYILEIESRAKGNIVSTVLETILSFQFSDSPQDEFISGFTSTFKTKAHAKAKNSDWQIKVPMSWKAEEADRPNIVKKFTSDYGAGNQSIMLIVKEFPPTKKQVLKKKELDDFFSDEEMKKMVPDGGKYISFTKMTLDGNIGGMVEYQLTIERLDTKIQIRMVQFMFFRNNMIYVLQGTVGSDNMDRDLSLEMKKYLPLYRLVANSIVVNDQYR
jgi:hypothetical protein